MESGESDDELVRRYSAGGDRAAMEELARRHVAFVYATARAEVGDEHLAEDVAQAVFLLLMQRARTVRVGRFRGWLFLTTRFVSANARKMHARRTHYERLASKRGEPHVVPADQGDVNPLLPLLNDALASLGARDREAVILRYLQGHGVADVCAALGITEVAGRKRLTRAVGKLRRFFSSRGVPAAADGGRFGACLAASSVPSASEKVTAAVLAAVAGDASSGVNLLANGAAIMIQVSKAKVVAGAVAGIVFLAVASGVAVRYANSEPRAADGTPGTSAGAGESYGGRASSPESAKADAAAVLGVVRALSAYGEKHGEWPADLNDLVAAGLLDPAATEPAGAQRYVYNKPPKHRIKVTEFLMLHKTSGRWDGHVAVAYGDGHVDVIRDQQRFEELVKRTRDAMAKRR